VVAMKETLKFKLQKVLFRFIGDIRWSGFLHPFWFTLNSVSFRLKGKHYRAVEALIQPGDILIRRFEGYVDKWLIPGWWNHGGIYIGTLDNKNHQVIHAISEGVIVDDLIDFMRTDHMVVLRAPARMRGKAIERAKNIIGSDYDFAFDFDNSLRFSCTELVSWCYANSSWELTGKKRFGRDTVIADDIVNNPHLTVIWDSRKDKVLR
jgi:hypothetical protein